MDIRWPPKPDRTPKVLLMVRTLEGLEGSPSWRRQRSRLASLRKYHDEGHPLLVAARAELDRLADQRRAEKFTAEVVPRLDAAQRERLIAACSAAA
jgi:hypothetical protein